MTVQDKIEELHSKARLTGMSIMGGYMPHSPTRLTDREVAAGLQRSRGWKLTPEAVRAFRKD